MLLDNFLTSGETKSQTQLSCFLSKSSDRVCWVIEERVLEEGTRRVGGKKRNVKFPEQNILFASSPWV